MGEGLQLSSTVMHTGEWSDQVVGRMVEEEIFWRVHWSTRNRSICEYELWQGQGEKNV